jgi:uncharacterized membrane protein
MSLVGNIHIAVAIYSVIAGAIVLRNQKGTVLHTWLGRSFVVSMLATDITAFLFIPSTGISWFHPLAVFNFAYIVLGLWHAYLRRSNQWLVYHYYFFAYAFLGVVAAAAGRVPLLFIDGIMNAALIAIAVVFGIGVPLVERTGKVLRLRQAHAAASSTHRAA